MTVRRKVRLALELVRAAGTMVLIEASLRVSDLPTTCRRFGVGWDLDSAKPPAAERAMLPRNKRAAARAAQLVLVRWPAGDTCLRRCLLLGHRLRRLSPVLRIGVKRDAHGAFSAHSWLEIGGRTLDESASAYAPLGATGR